jgi:hypothetical protein
MVRGLHRMVMEKSPFLGFGARLYDPDVIFCRVPARDDRILANRCAPPGHTQNAYLE